MLWQRTGEFGDGWEEAHVNVLMTFDPIQVSEETGSFGVIQDLSFLLFEGWVPCSIYETEKFGGCF